ncbi:MAG: hypothetical protein V5A44_12910 [Haloarculaceae archaeon]
MTQRSESHVTEWASLLGERVADEAVETGNGDRWSEFPDSATSR